MKPFLAVGDVVINPEQLAFAAIDGDSDSPRLRLVFGGRSEGRGELRLEGDDAKAALRWLRLNSAFANGDAAFGTSSSPLHWGSKNSTVRPTLRERGRCELEPAL